MIETISYCDEQLDFIFTIKSDIIVYHNRSSIIGKLGRVFHMMKICMAI